MKFYTNCSNIPIYNFFQLYKKQDYKYLVRKYVDGDDIEIPDRYLEKVNELYFNIYYEYLDITKNFKSKEISKRKALITKWEFIYNVCTNAINIYLDFDDEDALNLINEIKDSPYRIDFKNNLLEEIELLNQKLKGLKNKIKIQKKKVVDSLKSDNEKENEINIEKDAILLEQSLELKRSINIMRDSIKSFLVFIELNKLKLQNEQNNRNNRRGKGKSRGNN